MKPLRKSPDKWRLYVVTDERLSRGRSHVEVARMAIAGGADVIQLRDKEASSRKLYDTACQIRGLTSEAGVMFILNDRLDIALAVDADGLHVGQDDLPADVARRLLGAGKVLGVSAASIEEAARGERDGVDYLGVGPVFEARGTKHDAGEPRGLELIERIRRSCRIPVVAIGGINLENVSSVIKAGAHCAAVISAVVSADDVAVVVRELTDLIDAEKNRR